MKNLVENTIDLKEEKIDNLNKLADEFYHEDVSKVKEYATEALMLSKKIGYVRGQANAIRNLGVAAYLIGETSKAYDLFQQCYELGLGLNDLSILCGISSNIASYFSHAKKADQATEWYLKAIDYALQYNDIESIASIYNNLGVMHLNNNDYINSEKYFTKCIEVATSLSDLTILNFVKLNLVNIFLKESKIEKAKEFLDDVFVRLEQFNDKRANCFYYISLAKYYKETNNYAKAINCFEDGLLLLKDLGEEVKLGEVESLLARLHLQYNNLDDAELHTHKSLEFALKTKNNGLRLDLHVLLGDIYSEKKLLEQANKYYKKAIVLNKEFKIEEREKQALELERKHQAEKKEIENELLKSEQRVNQEIINSQKIKNELLNKRVELDKLTKIELERSNQDLASFAHIASHDIKAPMRSIRQFAQLLQSKAAGKLNEKENEYLYFIIDNSERLSTLIDDVLSYSKVGSQKTNHSVVDVNALFIEISAVFAIQLKEKNISLSIQKDLPVFQLDPIKIKRVFDNLIGNAIKFYDPNKKSEISISYKETEDKYIFFIVDNGLGIKKTSKDIFEPFVYLNNQFDYKGTGMGLALCKRIIEQHGGTIGFLSEFGDGTTFYFDLPKDVML